MDLISSSLIGIICLVVLVIIQRIWKFLFGKKRIKTLVLEETPASYDFYPAKRISSDTLRVKYKRKHEVDYYCAVEPTLTDLSDFPVRKIKKLGICNLYFHQQNKPFVHQSPIVDQIVNPERKNKILYERGFYHIVKPEAYITEHKLAEIPAFPNYPDHPWKKYIAEEKLTSKHLETQDTNEKREVIVYFPCSDVDFCREDFKLNVHIRIFEHFNNAGGKLSFLSSVNRYYLILFVSLVLYAIVRFDLWQSTLDFLGSVMWRYF